MQLCPKKKEKKKATASIFAYFMDAFFSVSHLDLIIHF